MRILIYGNTYLSEKCTKQLLREGFNVVGYISSKSPTFKGEMPVEEVNEDIEHDIKLSIQYDKKITNVENAYNLHTGLLPQYGGCSILYHTINNKEKEQGLTLHKMTQNFDEGGVISKMTYTVLPNDTVSDLYVRMVSIAPRFLSNAMTLLATQGEPTPPRLFKRNDVPDKVSAWDKELIEKRIAKKCCKIISVCMKDDGDVRTTVSFPAHNQNAPTKENMLKLVQKLYQVEQEQEAGIPVDIFFVNNDTGYKEGNYWLDSIDGTETKNGTIWVIHRENVGGSFGAYAHAFDLLKNDYEYFMFTEEDLFIMGDNYYKKAIEKLGTLGFLSFIDVERKRNPVHAHGGVGLTTRDVLNDVVRVYGELPHSKIPFDKRDVIHKGEIPFTNAIYKLGYELGRMGDIEDWDSRNYLLPYYYVR